jgi:mRNA-degrading endonuclease RelE of RelBE toxin-antitoxin system
LAIASKGKGKSGGARIITYVYVDGKIVYLLSIYDKSEQSYITDKKLKALIALIPYNYSS